MAEASKRSDGAAAKPRRRPEPNDGSVLDVADLRVWYAGAGGPIKAVDGVTLHAAAR